MTPEQALQFIAHEAKDCRDREAHEALCLLLPSVLKCLDLQPMNHIDAGVFRIDLHHAIRERQRVMTGQDFQ